MAEYCLFDVEQGTVRPSIHCYSLVKLRVIMEEYPDEYMEIYKYLYYMCSTHPKKNPFFNVPEDEREQTILDNLELGSWTTEDDPIIAALHLCKTLFSTPLYRSFKGFKVMLDRLSFYMETSEITDGRDGNITAIVSAAGKFDSLRNSFKGVLKDLEQEHVQSGRGNTKLAYDQTR